MNIIERYSSLRGVVFAEHRSVDELREQLAELSDNANAITAAAEREGRELEAEEIERVNEIYAQFQATEMQLAAAQPQPRKVRTAPGRIDPANTFHGRREMEPQVAVPMRPPMGVSAEERVKWAAQFFGLRQEDPKRTFSTFGGFLDAVANAPHDPRLQRVQAAAGESVGAQGGFLVPSQMLAQILGGVFVESSIVGRVSVVPMTSASCVIAGFNRNANQADGAIGGISFTYHDEAAQIGERTPVIVTRTLVAHKAAAWVPVSNELLSDSPFVSMQLQQAFQEAARARLELDIVAGDGVGKPLGILNAPSTIQQAAETQAADTITYGNVIAMASRLHPSFWNEAVWLASPSTMPQLLNLQVKIMDAEPEVVGGSHYLVETDQAGNFRILGRPVLFTAACKTVGDPGDLILVAPSQYALGLRSALSIQFSQHELFRSDETSFRATMRHDGQATWGSALTLPGTTDDVSWAVVLAERNGGGG